MPRKQLKLGSIKDEAEACRVAFKNVPVGALVIHCHHEKLLQFLTEAAENRIAYIIYSKSQHEQALRLHLFRPVNIELLPKKLQEAYAESQKADAEWQKAFEKIHLEICENCPWDGATIFPREAAK